MSDNYTPIECLVRHLTKKAVLVMTIPDQDELWIPLSVIAEEDAEDLEVGEVVEINVAEWFAEKEDL